MKTNMDGKNHACDLNSVGTYKKRRSEKYTTASTAARCMASSQKRMAEATAKTKATTRITGDIFLGAGWGSEKKKVFGTWREKREERRGER